jgi:lipopolysaccharide/colanic/teichoic acid biosynthesis glycosyltransferase
MTIIDSPLPPEAQATTCKRSRDASQSSIGTTDPAMHCSENMCGRIVPTYWKVAKRSMDVMIALSVLVLSSPLIVISILAISMASPGSPFFVQQRAGRNGRPFTMYKLRTMNRQAPHQVPGEVVDTTVTGPVTKMRKDPRVFPVGSFLRKTSLDELPNLVNVLLGEMSIVGPRPSPLVEHFYCIERYGKAECDQRLSVKPGITGLWQISGRSNLSALDERVQLDIQYAQTWTPLGDLKILLTTIPAVLFAKGAY